MHGREGTQAGMLEGFGHHIVSELPRVVGGRHSLVEAVEGHDQKIPAEARQTELKLVEGRELQRPGMVMLSAPECLREFLCGTDW